jgi:hypothetical protein
MVESPYSAACGRLACVRYAAWCVLDSCERGEAPFASHLFYAQVWPETPEARDLGLACRDTWARAACAVVAQYVDLGITPGMVRDVDSTARVEIRRLAGENRRAWLDGSWPRGSVRLVLT